MSSSPLGCDFVTSLICHSEGHIVHYSLDFWTNLNFSLEHQIKLVLNFFLKRPLNVKFCGENFLNMQIHGQKNFSCLVNLKRYKVRQYQSEQDFGTFFE